MVSKSSAGNAPGYVWGFNQFGWGFKSRLVFDGHREGPNSDRANPVIKIGYRGGKTSQIPTINKKAYIGGVIFWPGFAFSLVSSIPRLISLICMTSILSFVWTSIRSRSFVWTLLKLPRLHELPKTPSQESPNTYILAHWATSGLEIVSTKLPIYIYIYIFP